MRRIGFILAAILLAIAILPAPVFASNPPVNTTINGNAQPADGSSESSVTIQLLDSSNNPVPNDPVTISTNDSNARLNNSQSSISTNVDGSGKYNFQMTSTTANATNNVTVLDTSTNTTVTGTVIFYPPGSATPTPTPSPTPQPGVCSDSSPGSTVRTYKRCFRRSAFDHFNMDGRFGSRFVLLGFLWHIFRKLYLRESQYGRARDNILYCWRTCNRHHLLFCCPRRERLYAGKFFQ